MNNSRSSILSSNPIVNDIMESCNVLEVGYDYDCIRDNDTDSFTKNLDSICIIKNDVDTTTIKTDIQFIQFLCGFSHGLVTEKDMRYGYYDTKNFCANFVLKNASKTGSMVCLAWREYVLQRLSKSPLFDSDAIGVKIYEVYCRELHESNSYEMDDNDAREKIVNEIIRMM